MGQRQKFREAIAAGLPATPPAHPGLDDSVSHAPARRPVLDPAGQRLALANALRYFPSESHETLGREFAEELDRFGRIYMLRYRPTEYAMHARPIDDYPARSRAAAAIMLMIQNNLDPAVAQHPHELITYGGNGTVFQNWAQYRITMKLLSEMTDEQTLVLYSGHPLGLFPSHIAAPRLVVTCGMVIPNHSSPDDYERMAALGVSSYGQMTAGSFMYIGPQGIVHGTAITLLNAGRKYLGESGGGLEGKLYVSSGLGGMSGAQGKAARIAGAIGVIAEINPQALHKRHEQGWVDEVQSDPAALVQRIAEARQGREGLSIGYLGNVVDLLEYFVKHEVAVDLGSDQTSLHNPHSGGYYPAGMSLEEANRCMREDPERFREAVSESLRRHVVAINSLVQRGMHFWDYGNAFLLEASRAGAEILDGEGGFRYPSYVEDIMGPMCFDYGFGPFRWVCTSGDAEDLRRTDAIAAAELEKMAEGAPIETRQQLLDNLRWIREAEGHAMVVGSAARILYADEEGRRRIASAFNEAIARGEISAPVVLGRDHHDVSGTDSPYRETANIRDGSSFCADMAVQNVIGDAFRGASWVSLHNGGGVGWGEAINGGFGMLLDGSERAEASLQSMLAWDVTHGIARRAWARNPGAAYAISRAMEADDRLRVTLPHEADEALLRKLTLAPRDS
jgi:urocanate hydratase